MTSMPRGKKGEEPFYGEPPGWVERVGSASSALTSNLGRGPIDVNVVHGGASHMRGASPIPCDRRLVTAQGWVVSRQASLCR